MPIVNSEGVAGSKSPVRIWKRSFGIVRNPNIAPEGITGVFGADKSETAGQVSNSTMSRSARTQTTAFCPLGESIGAIRTVVGCVSEGNLYQRSDLIP